MTDKFVVPEPSHGAITAAYKAWQECPLGGEPWKAMLRRGYEWDVERIVREEVSHLHGFLTRKYGNIRERVEEMDAFFAEYRQARFGEESPSPHWGRDVAGPTERRERTFIPHMGGGQYINEFTQADRDRLARLERFVTALARIHAVGAHPRSGVAIVGQRRTGSWRMWRNISGGCTSRRRPRHSNRERDRTLGTSTVAGGWMPRPSYGGSNEDTRPAQSKWVAIRTVWAVPRVRAGVRLLSHRL